MYKNNDIDYLKILKDKKIFIFGAGQTGKRCGFRLRKSGYDVCGYIDNDSKKQGIICEGGNDVKIMSLEEFEKCSGDDSFIIISSVYENQIRMQLMGKGIYNFVSEASIDFGGGEEYYDEAYFAFQQGMGQFGAKIKKRMFAPYIPQNSVLVEFGSGGGYLLNVLDAKEKTGIEINDVARKCAEDIGVKSVKNICELPDDYADVVISNSALEHVENPLGILRELHSKLKDGGKIVFYVPNESCETEYSRSEINNHLYTWNCLNIGNLFKAAGFFVHSVQRIREVWPKNYMEIENEVSAELFDAITEIGGNAADENRCL